MNLSDQAKWYVIHTYSGHENKVKATIEQKVKNQGMDDVILKVSVPMEKIVEIKGDKEKVKMRKLFPGYCLVKMVDNPRTWYLIRNTKGVTGFVGPDSKVMTSLTDEEVEKMGLDREDDDEIMPNVVLGFAIGDEVEILSGPFESFEGTVKEIDVAGGIVKVEIFMFNDKETILDLELSQVKKVN
ncbi:MAG: transcription termination/antitermination protein NusG [Peptostreptococcaceae bacterium]|nr:transcription termination/antitermination protein NusG [Peptostreptococcaceae bacterium]